jgi:erythromycin esterase
LFLCAASAALRLCVKFGLLLLLLFPALLLAQSGWRLAPESERLGFTSEMRREGCRSATCAVVTPPAAAKERGILMRRLDAAPFRGRAVRLRAAVRLENPGPGDRAQLWLRVERVQGAAGFYDDMADRPITGTAWQTYEISGDVAADAQAVEIGILVNGKARVWVDQAALETLGPADAAAHEIFQKLYQQVDAAYAAGNPQAIASLATADAQVAIGADRVPLTAVLAQVAGELRKGAQYQSHSAVTAVRAGPAEAVVSVNNQTAITSPAASQAVASAGRDTWVKTDAGWRLKQSVLISTHLETPATGPEPARRVAAELKQRASPLPEGMAALGQAIGDARIVAMGAASYGTREFAEINRQAIQHLITQKNFTVVAIGANWAEAHAVDRYIKTGTGDATAALESLNAWPWETVETLELVKWMRAYNAAPGPHPILSCAGFDIQPSPAAPRLVVDYLKRYAPEEAGPAELGYGELRETGRAAAAAANVAHMLDTKHRELSAASGEEPWREARQAAAVAYQMRQMQLPGKGLDYRAESMAGNLEWLAGAHPNEKIVVWTHNANVSAAPGTMGNWLRQRYGRQLYTVGYAFRGGELRAVEKNNVAVRRAPPSPEGTGDAVLSEAGTPAFFLDMRRVPAQTALAAWLNQPHLFHLAGVIWNEALTTQAPGKLYDGLIFVEESHPTTELP